MADIFERDHLPKDKAVQSKLIRWIPLHHHAWSSTFLFYWHPFQTLHCQNPTETSHSSQEDSGTLYFNHRTTSNNDVNSIMCWVCGKKKKNKTWTETLCKGFQLLWWISHLIWPRKSRGGKAQPMSFISSSPLCYTYRKNTFYTWAFTSILGWGIYQGFDLGSDQVPGKSIINCARSMHRNDLHGGMFWSEIMHV